MSNVQQIEQKTELASKISVKIVDKREYVTQCRREMRDI